MRSSSRRRWSKITGFAAAVCFALTATMGIAVADGTETLGEPSIGIADATEVAVAGVGLWESQPGTLAIDLPADATIRQVLLYWELGTHAGDGAPVPDATIVVDGTEIAGTLIGGPTRFYGDVFSTTHRADVTGLGLVAPGANSLTVGGLDEAHVNDGVGMVVYYDVPGAAAEVISRDGNDIAFVDFAPPLDTTVKQAYQFAAADVDRTASLHLLVGSILDGRPRPHQLHIAVDGVETVIADPFGNIDGPEFDHYTTDIAIPAGATTVETWLTSARDGSGDLPASLVWLFSGLRVPEIVVVQPAVLTTTTTVAPTTTTTAAPTTTTAAPATTTTTAQVEVKGIQATLPATGPRDGVWILGLGSLTAGLALTGVSARLRRLG